MFWTVLAYGLTPLGILACILLLSGNSWLESFGNFICGASIKFGSISLRLDRICTLLAILTFSVEAFKLNGEELEPATVEMQDRQMMSRWRHERNYWISLYMMSLWIVAGRVAYLVENRIKDRPKWE